jgi:hypothetical protein
MPDTDLTNPQGFFGLPATSAYNVIELVNGDAAVIPPNNVIQLLTTGYTGTAATQPGPMPATRSLTVANFLLIGVSSPGLTFPGIAPTSSVPIGATFQVVTQGVIQISMDGTLPVNGGPIIQSVATAGLGHYVAGAVLKQTVGTVWQSSGLAANALAWSFVNVG